MAVALSPVFVIDDARVRPAALSETRTDKLGRTRCRVQYRGEPAKVHFVDPAQVFPDRATALERWEKAREHQAKLKSMGRQVRILDAHLSLTLAEAS